MGRGGGKGARARLTEKAARMGRRWDAPKRKGSEKGAKTRYLLREVKFGSAYEGQRAKTNATHSWTGNQRRKPGKKKKKVATSPKPFPEVKCLQRPSGAAHGVGAGSRKRG